jgi:hypothetical protein
MSALSPHACARPSIFYFGSALFLGLGMMTLASGPSTADEPLASPLCQINIHCHLSPPDTGYPCGGAFCTSEVPLFCTECSCEIMNSPHPHLVCVPGA